MAYDDDQIDKNKLVTKKKKKSDYEINYNEI